MNKDDLINLDLEIANNLLLAAGYVKVLNDYIKRLKQLDDNILYNNFQYIEALKYCNNLFIYLNKINFILDLGVLDNDCK